MHLKALICSLAMALAIILCSCSGQVPAALATPEGELSLTGPVDVVVVEGMGVREGCPAPSHLPDAVESALLASMASGGKLAIVSVEGEPRVLADFKAYGSQKDDAKLAHAANQKTLSAIWGKLASGEFGATTPEADAMAAIDLGAKLLKSSLGGGTKILIVEDSLVATDGLVDFAGAMSLESRPDEVADWLKAAGVAPDLEGISVLVFGCGQVAGEQAALSKAEARNLEGIWRAILQAGGPNLVAFFADVLATGDEVGGQRVTPVAAGADPSFAGSAVVLAESVLAFTADTAAFADPDTASAALDGVAAGAAGRPVAVTAYTASFGDAQGRLALSTQRAQAVAAELEARGVAVAKAAGSETGLVEDRDEKGQIVPALAAKNRVVVIEEARA